MLYISNIFNRTVGIQYKPPKDRWTDEYIFYLKKELEGSLKYSMIGVCYGLPNAMFIIL